MPEVAFWFSWDRRPAVELADRSYWAIVDGDDGPWERLDGVSSLDVTHSAAVLSPSAFARSFPTADPSNIPTSPAS